MRAAFQVAGVVALAFGLWWVAASGRPHTGADVDATATKTGPATANPAEKEPLMRAPDRTAAGSATSGTSEPDPPADRRDANAPRSTPSPPTAAVPAREGPIEALQAQFERESADAAGRAAERSARDAFRDDQIPATMLASVECRTTVCRAELRWTEQTHPGYVLGLTRALQSFSKQLGIAGASEPDRHGVRLVVVYWMHARADAPPPYPAR